MRKKWLVLVLAAGLVGIPAVAQQSGGQGGDMDQAAAKKSKSKKEDRWEGIVIRSSKDKKTLTVQKRGSGQDREVMYDENTKWVAQEHGSKKVQDIDSTQVKDQDRIIAVGTFDKNGVLHATLISKRLTR